MSEKGRVYLSYNLNKHSADALRQEASALTNDHETRLYRPLVEQTVDYMKSQYGRFMVPKKKRQLSGLENRMYVVDSQAFKTLYEEWGVQYDENGNRINEQQTKIEPDIRAFTLGQGGIMVFEDRSSEWSTLDDETKQIVTHFAKSKNDAKHLLASTVMANPIAHETIHNMHQDGIPEAFMEICVRYFANEFLISKGLDQLNARLIGEKTAYNPVSAYIYLTEKFETKVLDWFFGQKVEDQAIHEMWQTAELLSKYYQFPFKRYLVKD